MPVSFRTLAIVDVENAMWNSFHAIFMIRDIDLLNTYLVGNNASDDDFPISIGGKATIDGYVWFWIRLTDLQSSANNNKNN